MIYVGIGSNLSSKGCSTPYQTVLSAIEHFPKFGLKVCKQSDWYESEPVPVSSQPWFINGVVEISSTKGAASILKTLHLIEDSSVEKEVSECCQNFGPRLVGLQRNGGKG